MKFLIASDLHGSAHYTRQLLEKFEQGDFDKLVLLGDILYHGPRNHLPEGYEPKQVIELLSQYQDDILAIKGNCDAEVDEMVLPFPLNQVLFLHAFEKIILCHHGHHPLTKSKLQEVDVVLSGHTHLPGIIVEECIVFCNPGSISIPKQAGYAHTYAVMDESGITIFDFEENEMQRLLWTDVSA